MSSSSLTPTTYKGSCHCGSVSYTVLLPQPLEATKVMNCNCTLCTKNGYLNVYPKRKDVVIKGKQNLSFYIWSKKSCEHQFCTKCGSSMFASPRAEEEGGEEPDNLAINVRMLEDIALDKLQYRTYNGKAT